MKPDVVPLAIGTEHVIVFPAEDMDKVASLSCAVNDTSFSTFLLMSVLIESCSVLDKELINVIKTL
jgi:hypothetical protein